jgi:hypothetical protein
VSLLVIIGTLAVTTILSLARTRREARMDENRDNG